MTIKKIVWAVDPFKESDDFRERARIYLRRLSAQWEVSVLPVYVLSSEQLGPVSEATGPWLADALPDSENALAQCLKDFDLPGLCKPQVIHGRFASTAQSARLLGEFASSVDADALLVCTHGRGGMARLLLGSFTETLLDQSPVPILVLGPRARPDVEFKKVLFPTDFSPHSGNAFRVATRLCQEMGSSLLIFHLIPRPVEPILQSGAYLLGGAWVPVHDYFSVKTPRHSRHAELWARWARGQQVSTDVVIDPMAESIPDQIVRISRERKMDLIVMEHKQGPIASTLLGSITRQVIRAAACPVWLLRPSCIARKKRIPGEAARRVA